MVVSLGCGTSGEPLALYTGGCHAGGLGCLPSSGPIHLLPAHSTPPSMGGVHTLPSSPPPVPPALPASPHPHAKGSVSEPSHVEDATALSCPGSTLDLALTLHLCLPCSFRAVASQISQNALLDLAAPLFTLLLSNLSKEQIQSHCFPA